MSGDSRHAAERAGDCTGGSSSLPPLQPAAAVPPPTTPPRRSIPIRRPRCTPTPTACSTTARIRDAAKKFEDLDRDHPYAPEARRAIVMAAYAYYKAGKYPEAHRLRQALHHAASRHQGRGAGAPHHRLGELRRDQGSRSATRPPRARRWPSSRLLVQRYPDSPYTKQANNRIRIAEDMLAASEMNVGRYYQNRRTTSAAINRYKTVVTEYQTTRAGRRGAVSHLSRPTWRSASCPRRRRRRPCSGTTSRTRNGTSTPTRCCKSGGVSPQIERQSHVAQQDPEGAHAGIASRSRKPRRQPTALARHAVARRHAGAAQASDVPTASAPGQAAARASRTSLQ